MEKNNNISMKHQKGFSLVELSVVLVIIGLVVSVVTAGVTVQKTSELRSIVGQIEQYRVAIEGFDDKYEEFPGDMPDAHEFWGAGDNVCGTAAQCNGDGDGDIELGTGNDSESHRAWQHLFLSGYIDGDYTGEAPGATRTHTPFENCPGTSRTGGGYHIQTLTDNQHTARGDMITVGGFLAGTWPANELLTPSEAFYIDRKTDDGDPDDGRSQARDFSNGAWRNGCLDDDVVDGDREYVRDEEDELCIMFFTVR